MIKRITIGFLLTLQSTIGIAISQDEPLRSPFDQLDSTAIGEGGPQLVSKIEQSKGAILSLEFSPHGEQLVIAYLSGYLLLTNFSGHTLGDWHLEHPVRASFAPDGRHLLAKNGNGTAYVLRLSSRLKGSPDH